MGTTLPVRGVVVLPGNTAPMISRSVSSPSPTADPSVRPSYVATDLGSPSYLALAPSCPAEIAEGGEGGAEMGVHHHLGRPLRVRATARLLAPYVPVGLELGVRAPVAVGRS